MMFSRLSSPRIFCAALCFLLLHLLNSGLRAAPTNLNIQLLSNVKPSSNPISYGDVWAENDIACLGVWLGYSTYNYGVGIYSISNPAAPVLLSVYATNPASQNQFELGALRHRIGYFGSWSGGGLHIVSLTNPALPKLLCRVGSTTGNVTNGFDRIHTLFLERNFLYQAAHVTGSLSVKVFDVSNPAAPVFLQNIVTTNTTKVHQITTGTKGASVILYTSGWGGNNDGNPSSPGQTDIWDVTVVGSQPAQWLGRIYSGYNSHSSWPTPDGNTLVSCREAPGGDVRFYDISNPSAISSNTPPLVTLTPASMGIEADIPHNPVVVGNYLFLSWYQNGIQIFDISDRIRPVRVGYYDTFPDPQFSSFQGNWGVFPQLGFNKLLLSDVQSGLFVMDASAVLTPANNYPPLLVTQPASLTVTQGATAVFAPVVTGSSLNYQWRFNGANLAGATQSSLILSNAQAAHSGSYSLVVSNVTLAVTSSVASLSVSVPQGFQTVFYEPFNDATAATNWSLFEGSIIGIPDYTADWSFDYGTYFSTFHNSAIPPAPNTTNGSTRGLRLSVNKNDAIGSVAGVSAYPINKNFSGTYRMRCDMWLNYNGGPGGGSGSTEHVTFGINHAGTRVNWDASTSTPSDGVWFAVDGEGGLSSGVDYRTYEGNATNRPTLLSFAASGLSASGAASANNTDPYFLSIFPSPTYETAGAPGKNWIQVEISQDANHVLSWRMNGNLIAQRPSTAFTNGTVMIGLMDLVNSIASPAVDAFVLFDNVRVEQAQPMQNPVITAHPQHKTVYPEQDATFSVAATGSAPLTFQWRFNGSPIPGATSNSYTQVNVQAEQVGFYSVQVSNPAGSVISSNALLSLLDSPYLGMISSMAGERSALISWQSTVPANSLVQYEVAGFVQPAAAVSASAGNFGSSSYLDPTLTTSHVIHLTGLLPGTRYSYQVISTAGTNTYVSGVYQFVTAGDLIVDNPAATFTGSWTVSTISPDKYLDDYAFASSVAGSATATATFRPLINTPGKYDVYAWYPQGTNRANNAPYTIVSSDGSTTVPVNQQAGAGAWRLIGSGVNFARGTNGYVRLSNNANPSVVLADAVRFAYVSAQDFPDGQTAPAWWLGFFFPGGTDPAADADGDGYSTAQEYVMGTSPTNQASRLRLAAENGTNTARIGFWPLLGDRSYQLFYRSQIGIPVWDPLPFVPSPGPEGNGLFTISVTNAPQNFYRLKVLMSTNGVFSGSFAVPAGKNYAPYASDPVCGPNRAYVR